MDVGGKPLFEWTFDVCRSWNLIDKVVVATDIPQIIDQCIINDFDLYSLSSFDVKDNRTVRQLWQEFAKSTSGDLLLLQLTSPFRLLRDLDHAWNLYKNNDADVVISVKRESDARVDKNGKSPENNMRRLSQHVDPHYYITATFWIAKASYIATAADLQQGRVCIAEVHPVSWIDINTMEDLELARLIAGNKNSIQL